MQIGAEAALRRRAELLLAETDPKALLNAAPEEIACLLHELRVHQIELELQNEELRRTQEELERSRARYFDLYDLAPVGYVTLSAKGMIQEANLTATTVLGVSRSALIRRSLALFVLPEDQAIYYLYRTTLTQLGGPQACELRMLRPNGTVFWARLETSVAHEAACDTPVYRTMISDISARIAAEAAVRELNATLERRVDERTAEIQERAAQLRHTNAELARALRLKDEFLTMMSHELRTPLSIVLSLAEALSEELYGPLGEAQRQALDTVAQSGRHLLALLSDILDLARIGVDHETLELQPVSVSLVCQVALQMVSPAAQAKGIQISHLIGPGVAWLRADEHRLTQILVNLLNNAVKFTPDHGAVGLEIVIDATQRHMLFSVWDTGVGVAPEDRERIFEPFIQVDSRLARHYGGIGLGLALVHRLAALHGGSVGLVSALGQGSRFTVSMPWSATDDAPEAPGSA